jgi:hypothetical protein
LCCPTSSNGTMNPSDSHTDQKQFRFSLICSSWILHPHQHGSPALHSLSSLTCHPCYPGRSHSLLPFLCSYELRFSPYCHRVNIYNSVYEATYQFTFVAACKFVFENLRPLIAQTPISSTTKVNGKLLGPDFNRLDKLP